MSASAHLNCGGKIARFPWVTAKDQKKIYELSDLDAEVESVKKKNTIVYKLAECPNRALKYKLEHEVLYPFLFVCFVW